MSGAAAVRAASGQTGAGTASASSAVRKVSLSAGKIKVKTVTVKEGGRIRLQVLYKGKDVSAGNLYFRSARPKIVSVSKRGYVTAKKAGTARITVRGRKNGGLRAVLKVRVKALVTVVKKVKDTAGTSSLGDAEETALAAAAAAGQTSIGESAAAQIRALLKITTPHTHIWKKVVLKDRTGPDYPAVRCTVCGLERWTEKAEEPGAEETAEAEETAGAAEDTEAAAGVQEEGGTIFMIGDSYGIRTDARGHYTWPYQVAKGLGLKEGQALIACHGGYGFGIGKNFIHLLRLVRRSQKVRAVLVVGGVGNDRNRTKEDIKEGIQAFAKEVKRRFPNAKVYYAASNTHVSNPSWLLKVNRHRAWYAEACRENGWTYLSGCEKVLAGHEEYFVSDGHHPNAEGQEVLGRALVKKLKAAGI